MRLLATFARAYPWQSIGVLVALFAAGALEGMSLTALLPVLSLAAQREGHADPALGGISDGIGKTALETLERVGIEPTLSALLLLVVAFILLRSGAMLVAMRGIGYTVAQVATDLRLELLRALLLARWQYFVGQPVGKFINSVAGEAARASQAYLKAATLVAAGLQFLVAVVVALLVAWKATLVYLVAALVLSFGLQRLVRVARRAGKRQTKISRALLTSLTDTLQSVKPLKAMARADVSDAVLARKTLALHSAMRREVISKEGLRAIQDPTFAVLIAIAAWVGLERWNLPLATVSVMMLVLARVLSALKKLQSTYQEMVLCESAYWAMRKTIDEAHRQVERTSGTPPPPLVEGIRFDQVSFAYGEAPVLHECSFEIPAGSLTTLIGASGAGKTTVVDLVIGLLQPGAGRIWIDGAPLEELDLVAWRRQIGYVPQENLLLHDTVLQNVTLGDHALGEADAERALRAAGAWEFVARLPQGVHTPVGERGSMLSGGQRQRVMVARALVRKPRLLILDEATSALDPASAEQISATVRALRGEITILAISHQVELVDVADRVYRFEGGRAAFVTGGAKRPSLASAPPPAHEEATGPAAAGGRG